MEVKLAEQLCDNSLLVHHYEGALSHAHTNVTCC